MNPEAQRLAISAACGHHDLSMQEIGDFDSVHVVDLCSGIPGKGGYVVPDYLNDLDAMHEAEKVLTEEQSVRYILGLFQIVTGDPFCFYDTDASDVLKVARATAAQRAEALLKTLEESKP